MANIAIEAVEDAVAPEEANRWSPAQIWGTAMILPYILIFLIFVLYPVCYGLWIARDPQSYVKLYNDPIFARTVVNTLIFIVVAINVKMLFALHAVGIFRDDRAVVDQIAVGAVHPAVGAAVDSDDPVVALHAQPGVGDHQPASSSG